MQNSNFIGMGPNSDGPDIPMGLGMRLAQDPRAMTAFSGMSNQQKEAMIGYLQSGATGEATEALMEDVLNRLRNNQLQF